jgi:AcrR family transcriptional regulator
MARMKADDRRQLVLRAAMHEFGRAGFDSVSTAAIAERAGVSQPYVFRLFGTKKDLYVASIEERTREILERFRAAAASSDAPLEAMGGAYVQLVEEDPDALRCQLLAWAATADPVIGAAARASYLAIWREALTLSGAGPDEIRDFMAHGMLLTVLAALDLGDVYADPSLLTRED